ncbi:hypothetical protein P3S68_014846 [Capsicum galapagoense]
MAANTLPSEVDTEKICGMAEKEMEYIVEFFNKLTHTCFNKCVSTKYREGELYMGENTCIDRCVSKYQQLGDRAPPALSRNIKEAVPIGKEGIKFEEGNHL